MKQVTGCILIGGKSTRMGGGIKCLKKFNNCSIIERIIQRSKSQVSNLTINCNSDDKIINKLKLPIFSDIIKGYLGPLAGIHAALKWVKSNNSNHEWVVTFAGDTPFFPLNLVDKLYNSALNNNKKIIFANSFGRNHPIFSIWHISLEEDLKYAIEKEKIRKIELWARRHEFNVINFDEYKYDPFFNINKYDDLIEAEKIENYFFKK